MARKVKIAWREVLPFWAIIAFLTLAFFTGGAARSDVQSLIVLRPAAIVFCGIGLLTLNWGHVRAHRLLFAMTVAIFVLVLFHLVPLPPSVWSALPGRGFVSQVDKAASLGQVWRPLSMIPGATWNAFYSLFVPAGVLILGAQLTREQRFQLLPILIGLGLLSGFWGLLQSIGDPRGPLYLYRITNNGSAVGLFSNRNHQAALLAMLFPMLAVYASAGVRTEEQAKLRGGIGLAAGVVLVPLLLVTGSRAGLVLGLMGLVMAALLYRKPQIAVPKKRKVRKFDPRYALAAFSVIFLGAVTVIMSRAEALQRLLTAGPSEDLRFQAWVPIAQAAWKYFPAGSGIGAFVEVYQIDEPYELLTPQYFNHAHNDWLEIYMTAGLPGILLILLALIVFGRAVLSAFLGMAKAQRDGRFAQLGGGLICILLLGSIGDYPLRTPVLSALFVVAWLWLLSGARAAAASESVGIDGRSRLAP